MFSHQFAPRPRKSQRERVQQKAPSKKMAKRRGASKAKAKAKSADGNSGTSSASARQNKAPSKKTAKRRGASKSTPVRSISSARPGQASNEVLPLVNPPSPYICPNPNCVFTCHVCSSRYSGNTHLSGGELQQNNQTRTQSRSNAPLPGDSTDSCGEDSVLQEAISEVSHPISLYLKHTTHPKNLQLRPSLGPRVQ